MDYPYADLVPDNNKRKKAPIGNSDPYADLVPVNGYFQNMLAASGFIEPVAAMATGAIAKPLSDVAGLAAIPLHAAGLIQTDPTAIKDSVQRGMTYEPRTQLGQNLTEYNPLALIAKGVDWAGGKAEQGVNALPFPEMLRQYKEAAGRGVHEAVNQAPGFIGAKGPAIAGRFASTVDDAARSTMQSALKPPIAAQRTGKSAAAIDTMLNEGINVSRGGLDTLRGRVDDLNTQIASAITNSTANVSAQAVASRLQQTAAKARNQVNPQADLAAIQSVSNNFLNHPSLQQPGAIPGYSVYADLMPVQQAQSLKQGTYRALSDRAYGEQGSATIEAQKALARGLKEEVANAVPSVQGLNAAESKLLTALPLVERRVLMDANKNPAGLSLLAKTPGAMAAFMADRSALFKSLLARMLHHQAQTTIPTMGLLAGPSVIAISQGAGLLDPLPNQ